MSLADESSTHRLFAAIVLMGTGLTLGCGGVAESNQQVDTVKGNGGGGSASGSGTGTTTTIGGSGGLAVGGSDPDSITITLSGSGGVDPGPVTPGPFECPPQRWTCAPETEACGLAGEGWALPDDCACDATRPEQASDCGANQVFLCRNG